MALRKKRPELGVNARCPKRQPSPSRLNPFVFFFTAAPSTTGPCYNPFMSLPERITLDPQVLAGKPVIRGTRLAVEFILELLAAGQKETEIRSELRQEIGLSLP